MDVFHGSVRNFSLHRGVDKLSMIVLTFLVVLLCIFISNGWESQWMVMDGG